MYVSFTEEIPFLVICFQKKQVHVFKDVNTKIIIESLAVIAKSTKQINKQKIGKNLNDYEWVLGYLN